MAGHVCETKHAITVRVMVLESSPPMIIIVAKEVAQKHCTLNTNI